MLPTYWVVIDGIGRSHAGHHLQGAERLFRHHKDKVLNAHDPCFGSTISLTCEGEVIDRFDPNSQDCSALPM